MRFVSACTRRTSVSCSRVVIPGLSAMKSLPWCITRMPSGARSLAIEALTTSCREGSSRISASLRASLACGLRFEKAAARSGSFAKNETSSPPPFRTESTWPLMWSWFRPMAAKRMRGAPGVGSSAEAVSIRAAVQARPAAVTEDLRNSRRPARFPLMRRPVSGGPDLPAGGVEGLPAPALPRLEAHDAGHRVRVSHLDRRVGRLARAQALQPVPDVSLTLHPRIELRHAGVRYAAIARGGVRGGHGRAQAG